MRLFVLYRCLIEIKIEGLHFHSLHMLLILYSIYLQFLVFLFNLFQLLFSRAKYINKGDTWKYLLFAMSNLTNIVKDILFSYQLKLKQFLPFKFRNNKCFFFFFNFSCSMGEKKCIELIEHSRFYVICSFKHRKKNSHAKAATN